MTTVLLVDDEPTILRVLARELAPEGYVLRTASGGAEALARLAAEDVAVLVTDERMPGMRGTELISQAREASPLTVCILLVTSSDHEAAARALARGWIARALVKPWDFKAAPQAIRAAADAHDLRRRNETLRREAREISGRVARRLGGGVETVRAALALIAEDLAAGRGADDLRPTVEHALRAADDLAGAVAAIAEGDGSPDPHRGDGPRPAIAEAPAAPPADAVIN